MFDMFDLFHLDTKEDAYTFCLREFFDQSEEFRKNSAFWWGFDNNCRDYYVSRSAIEIEESKNRKKIIPDLVLYNNKHIAVIESKMYSHEGYMQTIDYEESKGRIKEYIKPQIEEKYGCNAVDFNAIDISFYYFTLTGAKAKANSFEIVMWADYYSSALEDVAFADLGLNVIGQAILKRAKEFKQFTADCEDMQYKDIVMNNNRWISPYSLFSEGLLDSKWGLDLKTYGIYNGGINGQGHSTFRTDIYKKDKQLKLGDFPQDNIYIFTRIEWGEQRVNVALSMEYWLVEGGVWQHYIPNNSLPDGIKESCVENRKAVWGYLIEKYGNAGYHIPSQKNNSLQMMIYSVNTEKKTLGTIMKEVSQVVSEYEEIKDFIVRNTTIDNKYLKINI